MDRSVILEPQGLSKQHCSFIVVVATAREAAPVGKCFSASQALDVGEARLLLGEFAGRQLALLQTGVGPKQTRRALEEVFERLTAERILLAGVCGGISARLRTGDSFFPQRIQDARGDFWLEVNPVAWVWVEGVLGEFPQRVLTQGVLASVDTMLGREGKRQIHNRQPAVQAVDMEALEFGRFAHERGAVWAVLKTVADPLDFDLPADLAARERSPNLDKVLKQAIETNGRLVKEILRACP